MPLQVIFQIKYRNKMTKYGLPGGPPPTLEATDLDSTDQISFVTNKTSNTKL